MAANIGDVAWPFRADDVSITPRQVKKLAKGKGRIEATYFWFYNLQIPHLDAARGEIRYFKLDADRSLPLSPLRTTHTSPETPGHAAPMLVIAFN